MHNRKTYEIWLLFTYILVVLTCIYLNLFSAGQAGTVANLTVNIVMLVIVAAILLTSYFGSLLPVMKLTSDLKRVTEKLDDDARHTHRFLWEKYKEEKDELFENRILRERFKDYGYELDRILHMDKSFFKCDIEDYINYGLIDSVIHRNRMNQVAGVMTGLGILGTFIGLSLGLQSFNTGSTAEITNSIDPLMGGIKVAFHTSIYGMVFSLVFNWVYKMILDDADRAVNDFINSYKKYVMPDAMPDSVNRLIELEQKQTEAIESLSQNMTRLMSGALRELLDPQFARLDDTITGFANVATKNQMDQLSLVVNAFINEMNRSLNSMFTALSDTIDKTLVLQTQNEKQMREIFDKNVSTADNIGLITDKTGEIADALKGYADRLQALATQMNNSIGSLERNESKDREILDALNGYIAQIEEYRRSVGSTLEMTEAGVRAQSQMLSDIRDTTAAMPADVSETFEIINNNLQMVENQFRETIERVGQVISQMNGTIDYSYRNIEQSFVRTARSIEELAGFMQRLENYYTDR